MNNTHDQIVKNLFVGNKDSIVETLTFDLVVNCTPDIPFFSHFKKIRIPVNDLPEYCDKLLEHVKRTDVIDKIHCCLLKDEKVLIHCHAGAQRSCAVAALYLIEYYQFTPAEAIYHLRKTRPIAFFGNVNFMNAIEKYYHQLKVLPHKPNI